MTQPISFHLRSAEETEQLGAVLGDLLRSRTAHPGAIAILLSGELGAGKTTFVRGLAEGLGADGGAVASPTFTMRMDHRGERSLAHIDAWRLQSGELEGIGFDELLAGDGVVAIEWPERIANALPARHLRMRLEHAAPQEEHGEAGRTATIDAAMLGPRENARIGEGLSLLVRAPRLSPAACPVCGKPLSVDGSVSEGSIASPPAGESRLAQAGESLDPTSAPFCSPRCRLADLGDWLMMRHRIVGKEHPEFDE
ncbi:MAG: tRNA (adenosine(37)-N6)-threonylcarbamoyltransferase complex ATPase subunit type 1 TsaE [Planctomycetaceae bacterium]|nr:tRNA (adenosine(37)-N6)-threonylcarbamoyltransferase complex ATPase subunit type 1 TsaE [Planctomycetaceae bacterium]